MTNKEKEEVEDALLGLLKIAQTAMPDTYYETDKNVLRARALLKKVRK